MTLAASGTLTLTGGSAPRDVATELGRPGTQVIIAGAASDADVKTLILYSGSGSVVFPADFYGKTAFSPVTRNYDSGSGNDTIPSGASQVVISAWGAGGDGGLPNGDQIGGGGGGGGQAIKTMAIGPSDWGGTLAYAAIGVGSSSTSSGTVAAGSYSIAGNVGSNGGNASAGSPGSGGAGGSGSGGDTNTSGDNGQDGGDGGSGANGGGGGGLSGNGTAPGGGGGGGSNEHTGFGGFGAVGRVQFHYT